MGTQEELKASLQRERDELERLRGELRVQLHLASAEARDTWEKLEKKWHRIEGELERIGDQAKGPVEDMGRAARSLIDEVKRGYARVREQVRD